MKRKLVVIFILVVLFGVAAFYPVGGNDMSGAHSTEPGPAMDLSSFSDANPGDDLRVLFIHHSTGGQLLAEAGPESGNLEDCIYDRHPNGGGLRRALTEAGYEVHEASYNSEVGNHTDMFDWLPKFRDSMEPVLNTDSQDDVYSNGEQNHVVMFKSCFPNSNFVGDGEEPGNPAGEELTYWNARATLSALLEHFAAQPNVLFVYFTAPPLAPPVSEPLWKVLARKVMDRPRDNTRVEGAAIARRFNNWVRSPDGWLQDYPHNNVVVFDYYDVLTNHGSSNMLLYPTRGGVDSHPSTEGQQLATNELVPFLNRAVRRAGLLDSQASSSVEEPPTAQPQTTE